MGLNIYDQQFAVNFGSCQRDKTKCLPCTPIPAGPWSDEAPKVYVGGPAVLVETAKMTCALGGEITITDPGPENIYSGDELFIGADGRAIIARGTHEEVEKMKEAEGVREFINRADYYVENPFLSGLEALANTLSKKKENEKILRPLWYGRRRGKGKGWR